MNLDRLFRSFLWLYFLFLLDVAEGQNQQKIAANYKEMLSLSNQKSLISVNKDIFIRLVKTAAKNYSVIVLFTAINPQRGCQLCQVAHSEMLITANSLARQPKYVSEPRNVFLTYVDFDNAPEVFQLMKFQSAPIILHFPPTKPPQRDDNMDLSRRGVSAHAFARFITEVTGVDIVVVYPPDYSKIVLGALVVLVLLLIAYFKPKYYKFFLQEQFWVVIVMTVIICMLSGQMWNHIRGAPFAQRNADGSSMYMTNHSHAQFVAESYIVAALYSLITVGLVLLGDSSKKYPRLHINRTVVSIVGLVMTVCVLGYLLSILTVKYPGYLNNYLVALE